ncbi:MAG: tetratricopeptide repeat protein, partial [Gammaproteobacteria bacterium]|nr:tetratricopeptide repeat protein [Gammaproteobacteria bacterium]
MNDFDAGRQAMQAGQFHQAREHLVRVAPGGPEFAIAQNLLAQIELRQGDAGAALPYAQRSAEVQPDGAAHWYTLARVLEQLESYAQALDASARAVQISSDHYESWLLHGNLAMRSGKLDEALDAYRAAIALHPERIEARVNEAAVLDKLERTREALSCFDKILKLKPDSPQLHLNVGRLHAKIDEFPAAIDAYTRALTLDQSFTDAWINLATAFLRCGESDRGLMALQRCLEVSPADRSATALALVGYLQRGDRDSYRALHAFDDLIYGGAIEAPPGFDSVDDFNRALARAASEHKTLIHEPFGKATRKGYQSGNLLVDDETGLFSLLRDQVQAHVERFLARPLSNSEHPYAQFTPEDCHFYMWATVLDEQGHQNPHIHPAGWVSGVYYVQVDDIDTDDQEQAGWIEFGRPEFDFPGVSEKDLDIRLFPPRAGQLFLFPSYFHHRTIPYRGDKPRISLAFDYIPKKIRLRRHDEITKATPVEPMQQAPQQEAANDMKVETHFAVPLVEFRKPEPEGLCKQLSQFFLDCEQDPGKYRNEIQRSTQHGLFESRFDLFDWQHPAVKELAAFCHRGVASVVAELSKLDAEKLNTLRFQYHSWFHVTRDRGFQGLHNHQNASWSGIFCVDPGEQDDQHPASGVVRFHDPRPTAFMYMDEGNRQLQQPFNHGAVQVRHEVGKLLVFPSYLTHEIFPYYGERPRIVVAFNCWVNQAA